MDIPASWEYFPSHFQILIKPKWEAEYTDVKIFSRKQNWVTCKNLWDRYYYLHFREGEPSSAIKKCV